jgi:hypothetical protein
MIAEKDLRIGNWVLDDEGQPVQIEVIKSRDFVKYDEDPEQFIFLKNGDFGWCREVNGIPLTPEILEKAGFEKDQDGIFKKHKCLFWVEMEGGRHFMQIALNYAPLFNAPCAYVHQLQNLFFALTGKELELNPTNR